MIKIYIYRKSDGLYLYEDTGTPEYVINDISEDKDFTLKQLPNQNAQWYWLGDKWVADDTTN